MIYCGPDRLLTDPGAAVVKNLPASAGDIRDEGSIPASERSPGVGGGNLLQYSCREDSIEQGAWRAIVHGFLKSWTQPSTHRDRPYSFIYSHSL